VFRFENVSHDGSDIAAQYVLADFLRAVANRKIKLVYRSRPENHRKDLHPSWYSSLKHTNSYHEI